MLAQNKYGGGDKDENEDNENAYLAGEAMELFSELFSCSS